MSQKFDDTKLITLAKSLYYSRGKEPSDLVRKCLNKQELTNPERNAVLTFVQENALSGQTMSMTQMKREILTAIGRTDVLVAYQNTLNAKEVRAIYEWFVAKGFSKLVDAVDHD